MHKFWGLVSGATLMRLGSNVNGIPAQELTIGWKPGGSRRVYTTDKGLFG